MKRTILLVLMVVMTSSPCFAQEIEPAGMFSIEGTLWYAPFAWIIFPHFRQIPPSMTDIGFSGGVVYTPQWSQPNVTNTLYIDMVAASFFMYTADNNPEEGWELMLVNEYALGMVQPTIGVGFMISYQTQILSLIPIVYMALLIKIDDNWTPPEQIMSISPNQGEQGTTLTDVSIWSRNTTFDDDSPVEISFDPPDGLTISNINVISNTVIEFDLDIAVDAPVGTKRVIVTYDDGRKVVDSSDATYGFEVTEPAPPGEIVSISPNEGEQGTTLTDVTIMGADTTFEDDGVSAIGLMPPGGVTVSNINIISNTEIEFDLEIAIDAPVGSKGVIATQGGIGYLNNGEVVFEILEKTN